MSSTLAAACLLVAVAGAPERDPIIDALPPGTSAAAARAVLPGATWLPRAREQALADGLVKTRLLETLNRLDLAPVDETGALDVDAFRELAVLGVPAEGERLGRRGYVAAFGAAKGSAGGAVLRFLLVRIPVPVASEGPAADPSSPRRLGALVDAVEGLRRAGFGLAPKEKDPYGNTFVWGGRGPRGASMLVVYLPEEDELRVVVHASRPLTGPSPR